MGAAPHVAGASVGGDVDAPYAVGSGSSTGGLYVLRIDRADGRTAVTSSPAADGAAPPAGHLHEVIERVGDTALTLTKPPAFQAEGLHTAVDRAAMHPGARLGPVDPGLRDMLDDRRAKRAKSAHRRDPVRLFAATETRVSAYVDHACRSLAASCDGYLFVDSFHPTINDAPLPSHRAYQLATMLLPASTLMVVGTLALMLGLRQGRRQAPKPAHGST